MQAFTSEARAAFSQPESPPLAVSLKQCPDTNHRVPALSVIWDVSNCFSAGCSVSELA